MLDESMVLQLVMLLGDVMKDAGRGLVGKGISMCLGRLCKRILQYIFEEMVVTRIICLECKLFKCLNVKVQV